MKRILQVVALIVCYGINVYAVYGAEITGEKNSPSVAATEKDSTVAVANTAEKKGQSLDGRVAYVDPNDRSIIIDLGSDNGLTSGQRLFAVKVVKNIYKVVDNKETNEVIKRVTKVIGELDVTEIEPKVAKCKCVSGDCDRIRVGDKVTSNK